MNIQEHEWLYEQGYLLQPYSSAYLNTSDHGWFDSFWGIGQALPPPLVTRGMIYLFASWVIYFVLGCVIISFRSKSLRLIMNARLVVEMGAIYRHVDGFATMLPRFVTAGFIHYHLLHIGMNAFTMLSTHMTWTNCGGMHPENRWVEYFYYPIWSCGCIVGSLASWSIALPGPTGTFSVGASGGVLSFSFAMLIVGLKADNLSANDRVMAVLQNLVTNVLQCLPRSSKLQAGKNRVDWAAHAGGGVAGCLWGLGVVFLFRQPEEKRRFIGAASTSVLAGLTGVAFLCVLAQFFTGNADRVGKCLWLWIKVGEVDPRLKRHPLRRWTLARIEAIPEARYVKGRAYEKTYGTVEETRHVQKLKLKEAQAKKDAILGIDLLEDPQLVQWRRYYESRGSV